MGAHLSPKEPTRMTKQPFSEDQYISLEDIVRALLRRKKLFFSALLIFILLSFAYVFMRKPEYRLTAVLRPAGYQVNSVFQPIQPNSAVYSMLSQLVSSEDSLPLQIINEQDNHRFTIQAEGHDLAVLRERFEKQTHSLLRALTTFQSDELASQRHLLVEEMRFVKQLLVDSQQRLNQLDAELTPLQSSDARAEDPLEKLRVVSELQQEKLSLLQTAQQAQLKLLPLQPRLDSLTPATLSKPSVSRVEQFSHARLLILLFFISVVVSGGLVFFVDFLSKFRTKVDREL